MKKYIIPALALGALAFTACENDEQNFPDYEGGTSVYFAYQYPVRTIELGKDNEINTDLDNQHKFKIMGAMGGSYTGKDIKVTIAVDETLCDHLYFESGAPVLPMPSGYYQLASTTLDYAGTFMGGAEVQLTDAFFADPKALTQNYVIPVVMVSQTGAGRIITGTPMVDGTTPARTNSSMWDPAPMDYALYCVRYVNKWHGTYLVKEGEIDKNTKTVTVSTTSLTTCTYTNLDGQVVTLSFSGETGTDCTITQDGANVGSGTFVTDGEKQAWGEKDRDALYLKYTVAGKSYDETLVAQRRTTGEGGTLDAFNGIVEFSPVYK